MNLSNSNTLQSRSPFPSLATQSPVLNALAGSSRSGTNSVPHASFGAGGAFGDSMFTDEFGATQLDERADKANDITASRVKEVLAADNKHTDMSAAASFYAAAVADDREPFFCVASSSQFFYDPIFGLYHNDEAYALSVLTEYADVLGPHAAVASKMKNVLTLLPALTRKEDFLKSTDSTSDSNVLFQNGIFCATTGSFSDKFSSSIVFHGSCPFDYAALPVPIPDQINDDQIRLKNFVWKSIFSDNFGEEEARHLVHVLARGICGHREKRIVVLLGQVGTYFYIIYIFVCILFNFN